MINCRLTHRKRGNLAMRERIMLGHKQGVVAIPSGGIDFADGMAGGTGNPRLGRFVSHHVEAWIL